MPVNLQIEQPLSDGFQAVRDETGSASPLSLSKSGVSVNQLSLSAKEPKDPKDAQISIQAIAASGRPLRPGRPELPTLDPFSHYMMIGRTISYGYVQMKKWDPSLLTPSPGLFGAYVVDEVPFVLNPLGGKVGVGTVDPREALEVSGSILATERIGIHTTDPREALDVNGNVFVTGDIRLNGDIKLLGADCAENFDVDEFQDLEPGLVMVIGDELKLSQCTEAYDKRVAGVLSGAGAYRPGIVLDQQQSANKRMPLALTGKVYCKVDAQYGPISIGDLLTTSPTIGHAMKALDPLKAFGAVIGKALRPLTSGQGLIPVLVALQ
jgi:hypothetical protein